MLPAPDTLEPPDDLGTLERELWSRLMPLLSRLAHVEREDRAAAAELVRLVGYYLRLTQRIRELKTAQPELNTAEAEREASQWRETAREAAADFGLLPRSRVKLALVDATGEDVELKRLFGLD